jgi:hypothetical protein
MHEGAGRVVARAVVESAGDDVNLFRAGVMHVELQKARAGVDFEDLGFSAICTLPQHALPDAGIDLARYDLVLVHVNDAGHVDRHCSGWDRSGHPRGGNSLYAMANNAVSEIDYHPSIMNQLVSAAYATEISLARTAFENRDYSKLLSS